MITYIHEAMPVKAPQTNGAMLPIATDIGNLINKP
jgi:hypothetical protein